MAKSHCNAQNAIEEEDYIELEDSDYNEFDSDDSEEDPTFIDDIDKFQSNFSNVRHYAPETEEMIAPKLGIKDMKDFEEIQRVIDSGLVEKLKVEQCKVYLRNHGLRLSGKKDTLVQRIKEHSEILNGGGEKKFPQSSFVLNCKGDACMGDIVMFEQTVYEGYNIASRSATGPPCGKRIVAGRIVKESYGAAKQQHTFTVEVLWSKGHKPLPPLHPLLIKGRNLYKLNTLRRRWEDESERQRVLSEKHCRGSLARSSREARIQGKISKKMLKGARYGLSITCFFNLNVEIQG
uniref:SAP domain-containing protein n=1 Tax=Chenopodium quinoa TaxID=63459 RepID=A0A803LDI6_CHEQI